MRAVQPAISTGGSSSSTMRRAIGGTPVAAGPSGAASTTGCAVVAALRHRGLDRDCADERRAGERGEALAAAAAEDRVARAVGRDELAHVLDDAEHLEVRAPGHVGDARRDLLRALRRRGDDEHLGLRQQARQRHLDVAGAGRHVDQQVVEVAPAHVGEELLERLGEDRARATSSAVSSSSTRKPIDTTFERRRRRARRPRAGSDLAVAVDLAFGAAEAALDAEHARDEKPQMSASSTPTVSPRAASAAARLTVTDDLPTPPLPLPTAMTRVVAATSVGGARLRGLAAGPAA